MRKRINNTFRAVWNRLMMFRVWQFIGRVGLAFRNLLSWFIWKPLLFITTPFRWFWRVVIVRFWRFIGRVGLAARQLIYWLFWEPFITLTGPFWRAIWRFIGRMGLAIRHLLTLFIWRPLAWLARKTAVPLFLIFKRRAQKIWLATEPRRRRLRRNWGSWWMIWRSRWRVRLRRPQPPATAVIIPRSLYAEQAAARRMRLATAVISISIVLFVSFVTWQDRQPGRVSANTALPRVIIATPSPAPVMTATPTPKPTIPVRLTPWATPDPLNNGGSLAFVEHRNGNSDIYVLPVGQPSPIRLTYDPAPDRQPSWSPDGQAVAFASRRTGNWEIYIYDLNLGELRRATNDLAYDGNPSWSPDGQWLVYDSYQGNNLDIYITKADGSEGPYRLTEHPAPDFAPVWSPTGRHIVFTSWRGGNKDIFVMSLDAVSDETAVNLTASPALHEDNPAFSPDGRFLTYAEDADGISLIYVVPIDENGRFVEGARSIGQQGVQPVWSPDGNSVIAIYERSGKGYLIATSLDAWGISPQAYAGNGRLQDVSWSAANLPPEIARSLRTIDTPRSDVPLFTETISKTKTTGSAPYAIFELPVNAPSPYLNDAIDQSFLALRLRLEQEAGWDFLGRLDNMFESMNGRSQPNQPAQNWNKTGRAFDLYYRDALSFSPKIEIVPELKGTELYWRVYVRAAVQDGSQGEPLLDLPWDFTARYGEEPTYYEQGGKIKEQIPTGYYVDFTTIAADYGWTAVAAGSNWRTFFPDIRFWHYQNRQGYTWEQAMRQIYTAGELSDLPKQ